MNHTMIQVSRGLMRPLLAAGAVALLAVPALAQSYPTIVGSWYDPVHGLDDCTSHWGTHIKAMSVLSSESICTFDSVRRDGWKVTWVGECREGGDFHPNTTVTAIETNGTLDMYWNGNPAQTGLKRCPAGLSLD
jgi:hypothetical protein